MVKRLPQKNENNLFFLPANKLLTRGGEQIVNLSEHDELIFDSEAVKSDGASRRVQHFVRALL
jgi:hypothetical protein